jgi:hypothetical protein
MRCPEANGILDDWIDGELDELASRELETHLSRCAACRRAADGRRGTSESLRRAFVASVEGVEPPAAVREQLPARLAAVSRLRLVLPARIAAAAAAGLILGALAVALGFQRATPEETALAETLRDHAAADARAKSLREDASSDLEFVRTRIERREDPAAMAAGVALSSLERRIVPPGPPPAAVAAKPRLSVAGTVNGDAVELVQMTDGRVRLTVGALKVEAPSMAELLKRHAELCRRYAVEGSEGLVRVGESAASVDLQGRMELLWRTGRWDESVQWEAYRAWMQGRSRGAEEVERAMRDLQERCRRAAQSAIPPLPPIDLQGLLRDVKGLSREQMQETRNRIEAELRRLQQELRDLEELRGRAKGLRTFAEGLK